MDRVIIQFTIQIVTRRRREMAAQNPQNLPLARAQRRGA